MAHNGTPLTQQALLEHAAKTPKATPVASFLQHAMASPPDAPGIALTIANAPSSPLPVPLTAHDDTIEARSASAEIQVDDHQALKRVADEASDNKKRQALNDARRQRKQNEGAFVVKSNKLGDKRVKRASSDADEEEANDEKVEKKRKRTEHSSTLGKRASGITQQRLTLKTRQGPSRHGVSSARVKISKSVPDLLPSELALFGAPRRSAAIHPERAPSLLGDLDEENDEPTISHHFTPFAPAPVPTVDEDAEEEPLSEQGRTERRDHRVVTGHPRETGQGTSLPTLPLFDQADAYDFVAGDAGAPMFPEDASSCSSHDVYSAGAATPTEVFDYGNPAIIDPHGAYDAMLSDAVEEALFGVDDDEEMVDEVRRIEARAVGRHLGSITGLNSSSPPPRFPVDLPTGDSEGHGIALVREDTRLSFGQPTASNLREAAYPNDGWNAPDSPLFAYNADTAPLYGASFTPFSTPFRT